MNFQAVRTPERIAALQADFLRRVYNWMGLGLALTAVVAMGVASNPTALQLILGTPWLFFGLIIGELALVFTLSAALGRLRAATATLLFFVYAALNGLTLSVIFIVYTQASIAQTFFVTAGTFGAMSFYGYATKRDLASWGSFLFMGLIGIILASVVNIFLASPAMYWVITYAGIIVFVGLTAYDTQKLKEMALAGFRRCGNGPEGRGHGRPGPLSGLYQSVSHALAALRPPRRLSQTVGPGPG